MKVQFANNYHKSNESQIEPRFKDTLIFPKGKRNYSKIVIAVVVVVMILVFGIYKLIYYRSSEVEKSLVDETPLSSNFVQEQGSNTKTIHDNYHRIDGLDYESISMPPNTNLSSLTYYSYQEENMANAVVRDTDLENREITLEIESRLVVFRVSSDCSFQVSDLTRKVLESYQDDPLNVLTEKDYVSIQIVEDENFNKGGLIKKVVLFKSNFQEVGG